MFEIKCLLKNIEIKLCTRIECGVKQLLALITSKDDIVLHYNFGELPTVIKRIPWFKESAKAIQAICFDPSASWLLVVCIDSSLYIIPALSLVDKKQKVDCKWTLNDVTYFPKATQAPEAKPTSLVWWQTFDSNQNGLIGYDNGIISLISLTDGRCIACTSISEPVVQLFLCQDNTVNSVSLLINGESGQQWMHILEQHSGYLWPHSEAPVTNEETARSRLYSLKQMSVDKIAALKQKLVEVRGSSRRDSISSDTPSESSSLCSDSTVSSGPKLLPYLSDTYFAPQYARDRYLFSAFYKPASLLTVHAVDLESAPLFTHKLISGTNQILLTDLFIYAINNDKNCLSLISSQFSECRMKGDSDFNKDALVAQFAMENETIINIYKKTDLNSVRLRKSKDDKKDKPFELPKCVNDLDIRRPKIDTCVFVTNGGVYKISLSVSPIQKFVDYVIEGNDLYKAEKLSYMFGLNIQQLLESCGDLMVSRGSYHSGIILYKQAKVHILKRVLKLAVSADCKTLLRFVHLCLSSSKVDMSMATKIHIGNLAVMAYTELILRYGGATRIANTKDFMNFLRLEEYFDQILAVNVACQAAQWNIVTLLAKARGLQHEVVSALGQILQSARAPKPNDKDFLYAISEPSLTQSLLLLPQTSYFILQYVRTNIDLFPVDILQRLVVQLDPSQPCAIPLVSRLFYNRNKDNPSFDSTLDSTLDTENSERDNLLIKEFVETFIVALVYLIWKSKKSQFDVAYLEKIEPPTPPIEEPKLNTLPSTRPLSCGYEHAAIVRNEAVYTMGVSSSGCLGLGPLLTQSSPAKIVQTLSDLKVKVISVSCGRKHTLALTDYGVYAWGSNNYGQLGLGPFVQESPYPQIITVLYKEKIVEVTAGQYHSIALTATGKVYTWGWGIHGQLGHESCDNQYYPKLLKFDMRVKQVVAGHAHTLVLSEEGQVFGFGSNAFGQLEECQMEGNVNKYVTPVKVVVMPDIFTPIEKIASSYFHNILVREDQEIYAWGASPQEVRLQQSKSNQKQNGFLSKHPDALKSSVHIYSAASSRPIEQIAIGYRHTAILHNGKILWGKSKDDELSQPQFREQDSLSMYNQRLLHVSCGLDYTMALDHTGKLLAWGSPSMAQTILGRNYDEDKKADGKIVYLKNTKRVLKFPTTLIGKTDNFPIEVPGLPSMAITFNPTDQSLLFLKKCIPYSIRSVETEPQIEVNNNRHLNVNNLSPFSLIHECPEVNLGDKTLHFVLESYKTLYDSENILQKCLDTHNYQAASKIALLEGHYVDSLTYQLIGFKNYMETFDVNFSFIPDYHIADSQSYMEVVKNMNNYKEKVLHSTSIEHMSCGNSPAHILSASSSLDSIRHWDEMEHQGGCESPCEFGDMGDVRQNMSQYVQSLKNIQNSPPITSISKLVSQSETITHDQVNTQIKDSNIRLIIDIISRIVEFYIKKIYVSENHILMQNVLMKCIEFWLACNLPISVLEGILLKHMDKYFYPLSILLFCKNFTNNIEDEIIPKDVKRNSAGFLKEFSTKFCLQLCSMVLENVNKS